MQDWDILEKLWQRYCDSDHQACADDTNLWRRQVQALYANHIAHPLALKFLLQERPNLRAFHDWIVQTNADYQVLEEDASDADDELSLSAQQISFWKDNGYLVLPNVISAEAVAESCEALWEFLNASPSDPASWYQTQHGQQGLMSALYYHPRLNTNRSSRRIRAAFEQLYGHQDIYKTIDHVSFNPPETDTFRFRGDGLHWDVSLAQPIPERFQGLLYLTDCSETDGAFHCVSGFHHRLPEWLDSLNPGDNARHLAAQTLQAKAVPGNAGDFVIWHQALPHCATPNRGSTPRMVQYLTYIPTNDVEHSVWI